MAVEERDEDEEEDSEEDEFDLRFPSEYHSANLKHQKVDEIISHDGKI